ncbi:MAG TPA: hypothetical protein VGZ24_03650, partial [Chthoniobacterales bacterium]|nr:hypothetical protein [Chthoniobacterales bacterium]
RYHEKFPACIAARRIGRRRFGISFIDPNVPIATKRMLPGSHPLRTGVEPAPLVFLSTDFIHRWTFLRVL